MSKHENPYTPRARLERLFGRGVAWTALALARRSVRVAQAAARAFADNTGDRLVFDIEGRMAEVERRRHLRGFGTVSSMYQTYEANRDAWENYDWSSGGEEWTQDAWTEKGLDPAAWKASIIALIDSYVTPETVVLEIGPGAGRWTAELVQRAGQVMVADIATRCLDLCRERFGHRVRCFLVGERPTLDLASRSLDLVWSYDVFVHVNPDGADAWLAEISRLLKPGGHALIHHPDGNGVGLTPNSIRTSNLDRAYFAFLAEQHGLSVIAQDETLPHNRGELITVCRAPG